ncbi:unnamed protein product, partial [Onchocerca flexuosa]|uniref:Tetraspanin family protein n=1 Tax=Onchocerca flexuosa TaxID=387005 RepID=A0A183H642_9BILA
MNKMLPTTIVRITLFILFLQLLLCGAALITNLYSSLRFIPYRQVYLLSYYHYHYYCLFQYHAYYPHLPTKYLFPYSKILPNFMQSYGLFSGVFIINLYATFITIIASFRIHKFCFAEEMRILKNFLDFKLLKYELVTSSIATLGSSFILFILCSNWRKPIQNNILYAIKQAISDNDYAQDINIIQQKFQCCGISIQGAESNLIWLHYLLPDIAFEENLYNKTRSLPWSCCRSDYRFMHCDQFAYERFIVSFNDTNFLRIPSYATRFKKNWGCTSLGDCKQRREIALNSVYKRDCAQAFYQAFKTGFFYLNGAMSLVLG